MGSPNDKGAIKLVLTTEEGRESDHTVYENLIPAGLEVCTY